ncbi:hypothetical protein BDR06DRAFT_969456 [Suillus hirtellus]|nr:hypothetical protein BDR06DRAFT_969456 [Suillus hirtellus]
MSSNDSDSEIKQNLPQKALTPSDKHVRMDMVKNSKAWILNISSMDSSMIDDVKQNAKSTVHKGSTFSVTQLVILPTCTVGPASQSGSTAPGYQANANCMESTSSRTAEPEMPIACHLTGKEHAKKGGRKHTAEEIVTKDEIELVAKRLKKQKPICKWKKKFMSDEEDHRATGTIIVKHKALLVKSFNVVAPDAISAGTSAPELLDDWGFGDKETRPTRWGLDSNITTTVELKVLCIVPPNKKFRFTRLAYTNCNEMKIACTINGAGVRQRLQVKAKEAVSEPNINPIPRHPRTQANKSHTAAKSLEQSAPVKIMKLAMCSNLCAVQTVAMDDTLNASILVPSWPSLPTNISEPKPSRRDILRSIQDLGRRFDLLATNEWVDMLDARVDSVKDRFGWELMELEKQITALDAHWQSVTSLMGNLLMSFQVQKNDPAAHRPGSSNNSKYKLQNAAVDKSLESSIIGREYIYVCN